MLGGQTDSLVGVGGNPADLVTQILDRLAELPAHDRLVLDDQQPGHRGIGGRQGSARGLCHPGR